MRRRAWLTLGAVVLGGAGVVTVATANPSDPPRPTGPPERAAKLRTLALARGGATERELPATDAAPFSLVGIGWDGDAAQLDGTAQVRTRSAATGKWSGWQSVEFDAHRPDGPEGAKRAASEPLWVGPSTAVQVRVHSGTSGRALPKGLKLHMVDPGVSRAESKNTAAPSARLSSPGPEMDNAAFPVEESPSATASGTAAPSETSTQDPLPSDPPAPSDSATPTETATGTADPTATPTPTAAKPVAPPSTVRQPPIIGRAQWGADESLVADPAEYIDRVQAVYIHHTVGTNDYSCAESAALVRGIMTYHVKTNGWNDLGYNFLVDKCGQIFEGRGGGVDLPVRGAHTYGFNSYSTGIALLGDFEGDPATGKPAGRPSKAALQSAARVAAWKLGQYDGDPKGTVTLTAQGNTGKYTTGQSATMNVISGHRDAFATACPGENLYARLPAIRDFAAGPGRNSSIPTADYNRDGINDLVAGLPRADGGAGRVTVLPGTTDGPSTAVRTVIGQNSAGVPGDSEDGDQFGTSSAWGDYNGDGHADLVVGTPGEDDESGHTDTGSVTVLNGPGLNSGVSYMTSPAYRVTGDKLGTAVTTGDFNADGTADVLSVAPGKPGRWWVFESKNPTYATKAGWLSNTANTSVVSFASAASGDFDNDGYADAAVTYRDSAGVGRLLALKGSATGLQRVGILYPRGGRSLAAGDINGDGYDDLVIGQPNATESGHTAKGGAVATVLGSATGLTTTGRQTFQQNTTGIPGSDESGDTMGASVSVGDVDLDGYGDVLTGLPGEDLTRGGVNRSNAGMVILIRGSATGMTATGSVSYHQDTTGVPGSTEPNDRLGSAVSLTDLSGNSRADLALGADGEDANNGTILQLDNSGASGVIPSSGVYYGRTLLGAPAGVGIGRLITP
ncbi:FG-GAP-like repeat-containing protein [Streptomyces sp. HNM0645]|uniref:FG-GAP-like repeat-containing protein n=1 Tax=Streptomyces sp. HNM0645 TaxID=2782343 RepID=UPI0024B83133|nr:FG-GAP-like repeat-containing protein [Streptomyces sp. HNM0645]MDI9886713.1 FG-GAP-like repeat-containing protein [Streptomyces sp. HNM0645]